jgi:hypothetical protein
MSGGDSLPCAGCGRPTSARKRTTYCVACANPGKRLGRGRPMIEAEPREVLSASVNRKTRDAFKGAEITAASVLMSIVAANDGRAPNREQLDRITAALTDQRD